MPAGDVLNGADLVPGLEVSIASPNPVSNVQLNIGRGSDCNLVSGHARSVGCFEHRVVVEKHFTANRSDPGTDFDDSWPGNDCRHIAVRPLDRRAHDHEAAQVADA